MLSLVTIFINHNIYDDGDNHDVDTFFKYI